MRYFLSAGEASGDAYGAALVREMKRLNQPMEEADPFRTRVAQALGLSQTPTDQELLIAEGLDSLDTMEMVMQAENVLGFEAPDKEAAGLRTFGDLYRLVAQAENRALPPDGRTKSNPISARFEGIGGAKMRDEGVQIVADSRKWGAIGITQAVRVYFRVLAGYRKAVRALNEGPPGIFIPIDFGFANLRLSRQAKAAGWKVIYFIPPGSWRKDRQGKDLPNLCDAVITPFPWSAEILKEMGVDAHFLGHPLKQLVREQREGIAPSMPDHHSSPSTDQREGIAILPGSRVAEIEQNLPAISDALKDLPETAAFAVSPNLDLVDLQSRWSKLSPGRNDEFIVGKTAQVLLKARAGIVCSGTATLEAALCGCPHVVIYRISKTTEIEARLVGFKVKHISQPNILLDREVVPELIQYAATGAAIREKLLAVLKDSETRTNQLEAFAEIDAMLGPSDAITQSAEFLIEFGEKASR
ncbi:MAG: hypothetical protein KF784_12045 [Fimbriimonadaceae bacterium]|nr:hypothetical protein [Fimbriimonadaceae bacterium]